MRTQALQDAGMPSDGSRFGPVCPYAVPPGDSGTRFTQAAASAVPVRRVSPGALYEHGAVGMTLGVLSVVGPAVRGDTDSFDDDATNEGDRPRQQLGCGRPPFGLVPRHVASQGLLVSGHQFPKLEHTATGSADVFGGRCAGIHLGWCRHG
ncbi:hypothetical protein CYMTET_15916 [Cymbomonas tetramitiformis]|uniref:Uncharacterized protein n=1 Tax=Cymbomonas tetramitiformis TaxID=36881 RepID=A0AAE0L8I1_9CHLO|nr:hypothetical protein CYMTET_15916 [Cymbomonas tetramitiformis]